MGSKAERKGKTDTAAETAAVAVIECISHKDSTIHLNGKL